MKNDEKFVENIKRCLKTIGKKSKFNPVKGSNQLECLLKHIEGIIKKAEVADNMIPKPPVHEKFNPNSEMAFRAKEVYSIYCKGKKKESDAFPAEYGVQIGSEFYSTNSKLCVVVGYHAKKGVVVSLLKSRFYHGSSVVTKDHFYTSNVHTILDSLTEESKVQAMRTRLTMNAHAYGITNVMVNSGFKMMVPKALGGNNVGCIDTFVVVDIDPNDSDRPIVIRQLDSSGTAKKLNCSHAVLMKHMVSEKEPHAPISIEIPSNKHSVSVPKPQPEGPPTDEEEEEEEEKEKKEKKQCEDCEGRGFLALGFDDVKDCHYCGGCGFVSGAEEDVEEDDEMIKLSDSEDEKEEEEEEKQEK